MTDRPINMSADQVQALLAGKTRHRVVLKDQPPQSHELVGIYAPHLTAVFNPAGNNHGGDPNKDVSVRLPYSIGDRLWVREAFCKVGDHDDDIHACPDMTRHAYYAADAICPDQMKWRSSATMPRRLSRLTLIVTDVRVQRVQEISDDDAMAELGLHNDYAADMFDIEWDRCHTRPEHQWTANPWVCALTFDVMKANIDDTKTGVTVRQIEGGTV